MSKQDRLLIVDDEADIREVLRESLASHVDLIFEASNGLEALERLKTNSVHAILSDVNMPKMTGLELLKTLRARGDETPFIVLTGFGEKKMVVEALRLGAFDFLDKPWKETDIIDVVERAIAAGKTLGANG
jgi:DNA-binding NtrC family response regulator